jgi:hypothetical protein
MLTFTQATARVLSIVGTSDTDTTTNAKQDINQGLRLFKNAARRYWTRQEKTASLVASQQYYQLPSDVVRVTQVKVVSNGFTYGLEEVSSEKMWNDLNVIPAVTVNVPTYYFVRGYNEIGLWPVPSTAVASGLVVSYEPRLADMTIDDVTGTATVSNGSVSVTDSATGFNQSMIGRWFQVTDGTDGNWYKVGGFTSTSVLTLENFYQGLSGSGRNYLIGQVPDIPEDYHLGLVYFAAYNFFLKRKDNNSSTMYFQMFDDLLKRYRNTYGDKTTGLVQNNLNSRRYNIFTQPPNNLQG